MSENFPIKTLPAAFGAPIIFHIQSLYKEIYQFGNRIPKRDKLGLHNVIEKGCLKILTLSINASLASKINKSDIIRKIRVNTETLKHLIRTETELGIIKQTQYLSLEGKLQEISREAVGWEKYINKNSL